ncbi:MAG: diaminopimelate epimerase [Geminicoccaceae bacterium]
MITFLKMHGLGNDFVVLDGRRDGLPLDADLVRRLGDRHRGIGFDQLALLSHSEIADVAVRFYNPDGSEAGACGNASRCIAALVGRELDRRQVTLATAGGVLPSRLRRRADRRRHAGPGLAWQDVPLAGPADTLALDLGVAGLPPAVALSMGNPHAVLFVDDVDLAERHGAALERHPVFPERANIGFARVLGPERIRLRVFERGTGLTLACGSGACAALVAAVRRGLVAERATMVLDGGELEVAWAGEGPVRMTGPYAISFSGSFDPATIGRRA